MLVPAEAGARVFLTTEEALDLAFPGCQVERGTVFLTEAQQAAAKREAGVEIPGALVYPYEATCDGEPGGTAYFDTHRVRTLPETLMVVVDPDGEVRRVEVLAFREPPEYIPPAKWYGQFPGQKLSDDLRLQGAIRGVTGATLTARATTAAVRRVLAIHRVLQRAAPQEAGHATSDATRGPPGPAEGEAP
jgi:hypothetical protein